MKRKVLNNGIRVLYKKTLGNLTSFSVGFEAGANREGEEEIGVAHALEHILYKKTKHRNEYEINIELDNLFGFNNAMTNYPYVIYYGTCHNEDLNNGLELIGDILLNPDFNEDLFREELEIIKVESREWKDDLNQYCEDELFYNSYSKKRTREMIIGNEEHLNKLTLEKLINFYNKYYVGKNCVISVVTSLEFEDVMRMINKYFKSMKSGEIYKLQVINEEISSCVKRKMISTSGAKIQCLFNIEGFTNREKEILKVIDAYLAMGTSSVLYDFIRTKNSLAYEVYSNLKDEKGIGTYTLCLGTDKDKIDLCIKLLDEVIYKMKEKAINIKEEEIEVLCNRVNRNIEIQLERSIENAKRICFNELMFENGELTYKKVGKEIINKEEIIIVVNKLISNKIIMILG